MVGLQFARLVNLDQRFGELALHHHWQDQLNARSGKILKNVDYLACFHDGAVVIAAEIVPLRNCSVNYRRERIQLERLLQLSQALLAPASTLQIETIPMMGRRIVWI